MTTRIRLAACVTAIACVASVAHAQAVPNYHVVKKIQIGGDGGWDYLAVETKHNRLYVSHATHVVVIDLATDAVAGDIANTPGVHGAAFAPELERGFISNGRDSSVTIFDLATLATITKLHIPGINPDAITYDEASRRVFTFNHGTHDATVIDAAKGEVVGTIPNLGTPETGVVDGKGTLWVNIEDTNEIVRIDTKAMKEVGRFSLAPCEEPTGLAIDRANRVLFASCGSKHMAIVDADKGTLIKTLPIGTGADATAFDTQTKLAFASTGDGNITVVQQVSPREYKVVQTIPTQRGARTMTLDPVTHRAFVSTADYGPTPAPTTEQPRPRAPIVPGSFMVIVIAP